MTAADGASEHVTSPLGPSSTPGARLRWRRVFPGEERQLGLLRRWLTSLLPDCPARDDVVCVATELATNAVRHTASGRGGWFAVEIARHQSVVRVSVTDDGASSAPEVIDDPAGEHGRGLLVVCGLSERTGVCGDHRGRVVWADVPSEDTGAADPASSQDPDAASSCERPGIQRSDFPVADAAAIASARNLAGSSAARLPKRIRSLLPAASAGRRAQVAVGPEMLCGVLGGLNRL
jgi:serine/threonine-protein kinase RsbW